MALSVGRASTSCRTALKPCGVARVSGSLKAYLDGSRAAEESTISRSVCQQESERFRASLQRQTLEPSGHEAAHTLHTLLKKKKKMRLM